jgi:hypothetical protein
MSAPCPVFQEVFQRIRTTAPPQHLPYAACQRLALLVTGILAAKSSVLAQIAAELDALHLTEATQAESIARRLRRTLNDPHLTPAACYDPLLKQVIDWAQVLRSSQRVVVILDESTKTDQVHLLRASLPYWGGRLPLAGELWEQNVPLPDGEYWRRVEQVLARGGPGASRPGGRGGGGRVLRHSGLRRPAGALWLALGDPRDALGQSPLPGPTGTRERVGGARAPAGAAARAALESPRRGV